MKACLVVASYHAVEVIATYFSYMNLIYIKDIKKMHAVKFFFMAKYLPIVSLNKLSLMDNGILILFP